MNEQNKNRNRDFIIGWNPLWPPFPIWCRRLISLASFATLKPNTEYSKQVMWIIVYIFEKFRRKTFLFFLTPSLPSFPSSSMQGVRFFFSRFLSKFKTKSSSHRKVRVSIYSKINCNKLYSFCYGGNVVSRRKKLDQFIGLKSWTIQNKHWWHFVKILSIYRYIHARKCG